MMTTTAANGYALYDEKGSCLICSTSTVQRRVDKAAYQEHAQRHIDAGDPVVVREGKCLIEVAGE